MPRLISEINSGGGAVGIASDGVDLGNREGEIVDVIVGDDEVIIPKELVQYVGLDKLEKMNNRGKELMRAVQAASKEKQQGQA